MQFEKWFPVDLDNPAARVMDIGFPVFSGDNHSVRLGVTVTKGAAAQTVSGTVEGYVILPGGATVPTITGESDGDKAWIDLPAAAFVQQGRISVALRVVDGEEATVLLAVTATVRLTSTTVAYDPDDEIPTWDDILVKIAQMDQKIAEVDTAISENLYPVSYDTENPQSLTDAQKAQARANIGAAEEDLVAYGENLTPTLLGNRYLNENCLPTTTNSANWRLYKVDVDGLSAVRLRMYKASSSTLHCWGFSSVAFADATLTTLRDATALVAAGRLTNATGVIDHYLPIPEGAKTLMIPTAASEEGYPTAIGYTLRAFDFLSNIAGIPAAPTEEGTYTLKVTVSSQGIPFYSWESEESASLLSTPLSLSPTSLDTTALTDDPTEEE